MKTTEHSARPILDLTVTNVVGIMTTLADLEFVLNLQKGEHKRPTMNVVELRLDSEEIRAHPKVVVDFLKRNRIPTILTPRHSLEGGFTLMYPHDREEVLLKLMNYSCVYAIDFEIKSCGEVKRAIKRARMLGVKLLGSFHDTQGTPDFHEIEKLVAMAFAKMPGVRPGVDIFKVATMAQQSHHIQTLMGVLEWEQTQKIGFRIEPRPIAVMSIGYMNKAMRVAFAELGSVFVYGYTAAPRWKGQWPAGVLRKLINYLNQEDYVRSADNKP